jgi:hypothetical protein
VLNFCLLGCMFFMPFIPSQVQFLSPECSKFELC